MRHHSPSSRTVRASDLRCEVCARRVPAPRDHGSRPEPHRCALCQTPVGDLVGDLLAHRDAATAR